MALHNPYSEPKLFIPREDGKPSVGKGKYWYVYFYLRPVPGKPYERKVTLRENINSLKTPAERRAMGKQLCKACSIALERGWRPE
ncbi:hypothetical protein [Aequorivita echinoideorum]|uniref:Arm DNA-binding domain-containing protein n=1 Tax=Aequorivita echinoideorum TaxID=1549647 RepID=A0ABS5S369_9FLAO|nr:hypothetical protein [Aequorivita echinoideorum]MBT0607655.1 hypothetical protein [Aequorivita echinoideorum]